MSKSRAEARRQRKRRAESSGTNVWLDRIWGLFTRPAFAGGLLLVAAFVTALVPSTVAPPAPSHGWWVAALRLGDAAQGAVTLLAVAGFAGLAMAVEVYRRRNGRQLLPLFALALMGVGSLAGAFSWYAMQSELPTSRVAVPPGRGIDSFPAIESGRAFKVMLPVHITLISVDPDFAKATVELRKSGDEEGVRNDLFVGDPLPVGEFDFALVGLEMDPTTLSAVMKADDGIAARGTTGGTVRFTPDGPEYSVLQVARNYQGIMGPAVLLESEERGRFWVFQRDAELEKPLNDIHIERLETTPVAVFAVSRTAAGQPIIAAGILFFFGFAMLMLVRDEREDSLHELGASAEDV